MSSNESTTLPPQAPRRQSFTLPFPSYTSPIALAAAQTLRRSSTTGTGRPRADSMSSLSSSVASSIPADDVPIEEEEEGANPGEMRARLERRMSAGRGWVRPRAGSLSLGTLPGQGSVGQGSPTITRGFWLDPSQRARRQSVSAIPLPEEHESQHQSGSRERRASVSVAPTGQVDPLQERILKGEFIF